MFDTHKLNDRGFNYVKAFKEGMVKEIKRALANMPEGREKAIFKTKIEEAMFFGTKAIASDSKNHTEVIKYGE